MKPILILALGVTVLSGLSAYGYSASSDLARVASQLADVRDSLSALQEEHRALEEEYNRLLQENRELQATLRKRGNIRDLYAR